MCPSSHCYSLGKSGFRLWTGSSRLGSAVRNLTSVHENSGSIPGLTQGVKDPALAVSCGVGHRPSSDPALLWLWCGLAAPALIGRLAWEPPYAAAVALKRQIKNRLWADRVK